MRALVRTCYAQALSDEPVGTSAGIAAVSQMAAARYGLDADLIDVEAQCALPAHKMVERLLSFLRPSLEEHNEWEETSALVGRLLRRATARHRQREV